MAGSLSVKRRFSLAYLGLAAVLGTAIGALAVVLERPGPSQPPPWSSWHPIEQSRKAQQQQIAAHVGAQYRLGSGKPLVNVVVRDPRKAPPIQDIALTKTLFPEQRSDILSVDDTNNAAIYILCGTARRCAINEGEPSAARAEILRREALELALYTFRYVDNTDSVLVEFPPKDVSYVMYFAKGDLADQLRAPLRRTLARPTGPLPRSLSSTERNTIAELTVPRQYRAASDTEPDGSTVLYLAPR